MNSQPEATHIPAGPAPGEERIHPIRLARLLAEVWTQLPENQRAVCLEELAEGGVLAAPLPSLVESMVTVEPGREEMADLKMEVMRTKLQMHDASHDGPLDLVNLLGLITELAGHVAGLGDAPSSVWPAWQGMTRSSRFQPSAASRMPMSQHIKDFLDGRNMGNLQSALRDQQAAARLLVAILGGLGKGGQAFAKECSALLDPEMIHQEMRAARGRPPVVEDLWQRYKQLSNSLTPNEIEHRLLQHIVSVAEAFFHAR